MAINVTMMITPNSIRSGFRRRGVGIDGGGPYCGTPPPNEGCLRPEEGYPW
jgi:hypothetical protein